MDRKITDKIFYAGVKDTTLDLFESQYQVPDGVTYNSYVILDEQIAIMDTVDPRATEEWMDNLKEILEGKAPDYLIISHVEPDHGGSIQRLADACPQMKLVGNIKTFQMLNQFFALDLENRKVVVKEGDTLSLGSHTLHFSMAPMVHWPEVMVTYEDKEKILFSADGFGTFGTSMDELLQQMVTHILTKWTKRLMMEKLLKCGKLIKLKKDLTESTKLNIFVLILQVSLMNLIQKMRLN